MANEVFLTTANNLIEAKMLVEIMKDNGISAYYKNNSPLQIYEHIGAYIDQQQLIFVLEEDAERAKELIKEFYNSGAQEYGEEVDQDFFEDI